MIMEECQLDQKEKDPVKIVNGKTVVDIEDWDGEVVDYFDVSGELIPYDEVVNLSEDEMQEFKELFAEDFVKAVGYVPIKDFLRPGEAIVSTIQLSTDYFALTNYDRLLYITHWYGDSEYILVPNVVREVKSILNDKDREFAEGFKNAIRDLILKHYFHGLPISILMRNVKKSDEIWKRLMDAVDFDVFVMNEIERMTNEKKVDFKEDTTFNQEKNSDNQEKRGVYFIQADNGLTKIGRTKNLKNRLSKLKTSSPCELNLIWFIETEHELELEAKIHDVFSVKRVRGEWFDLTDEDMSWIKQIFSKKE